MVESTTGLITVNSVLCGRPRSVGFTYFIPGGRQEGKLSQRVSDDLRNDILYTLNFLGGVDVSCFIMFFL